MKITIENYEAYALDYLEGSLGHQEEQDFQKFLEDHPEIHAELVGLDQMIVTPDPHLKYPNKKSLYRKQKRGIIPLWNSPWMVAASIALILAITAVLFFKNPATTPTDLLSEYHSSSLEDNKLPATKPMPAELPETNVMAQQGNVPGQAEHTDDGSPALTLDPQLRNGTTPRTIVAPLTDGKTSDLAQKAPISHQSTPQEEDLNTDTEDFIASEAMDIRMMEPLAMLPVSIQPLHVPASPITFQTLGQNVEEESIQFEIHIPGKFLSETWTDVSLANIKSKLLPEFLYTRNNN